MTLPSNDNIKNIGLIRQHLSVNLPTSHEQREQVITDVVAKALKEGIPRFWCYRTILDYAVEWPDEEVTPDGRPRPWETMIRSTVARCVTAAYDTILPWRLQTYMDDDWWTTKGGPYETAAEALSTASGNFKPHEYRALNLNGDIVLGGPRS